jgi:hypothetical protein
MREREKERERERDPKEKMSIPVLFLCFTFYRPLPQRENNNAGSVPLWSMNKKEIHSHMPHLDYQQTSQLVEKGG